jgi:hypothetical protein
VLKMATSDSEDGKVVMIVVLIGALGFVGHRMLARVEEDYALSSRQVSLWFQATIYTKSPSTSHRPTTTLASWVTVLHR